MSHSPDSSLPPPTVAEALAVSEKMLSTAGVNDARRDCEVLLTHLLDVDRSSLFAHPERRLSSDEAQRLDSWMARRAAHEPIAYITGTREFWSLELTVSPDVLIPRPETECLVEMCLAALTNRRPRLIADIGTGSGAIVAALASELGETRFVATDISERALRVARENLQRTGVLDRVELRLGDLYATLQDVERLDAIVSNPPYISERDLTRLMPDVREYEPRAALAGGPDGLAIVRRLIDGASTYLLPGSPLIMEIGSDQGDAVRTELERAGFEDAAIHPDPAGLDRVASGRTPLTGRTGASA